MKVAKTARASLSFKTSAWDKLSDIAAGRVCWWLDARVRREGINLKTPQGVALASDLQYRRRPRRPAGAWGRGSRPIATGPARTPAARQAGGLRYMTSARLLTEPHCVSSALLQLRCCPRGLAVCGGSTNGLHIGGSHGRSLLAIGAAHEGEDIGNLFVGQATQRGHGD